MTMHPSPRRETSRPPSLRRSMLPRAVITRCPSEPIKLGLCYNKSNLGGGNLRPGSQRRCLHDEIYAALRQALIAGDLVPGQAFSIRTLAERFGTSLIPVRDALKRLFAEHALAMLQNRSFCVPK